MIFKYHQLDAPILLICKSYDLGRDIAKITYSWLMGDIRTHQKQMDQVFLCIQKLKNQIIDFESYDDGENEDESDINYGELYRTCRNEKLRKHYLSHQGFDHLPIEIPGSKLPGDNSIKFNDSVSLPSHEYFHGYIYAICFAKAYILTKKILVFGELLKFKISYREVYDNHLKHYRSYSCPFCLLNETNGVEREEEWQKERYLKYN